ncbi:MAG: hypothetical protein ACC657_03565 [Thiohalomonadales bacterium]
MKILKSIIRMLFYISCLFIATTVNSSCINILPHNIIKDVEDIFENTVKYSHDEFKFTKLISKEHDKIKFLNNVFQTDVFNKASKNKTSDLLASIPEKNKLWHLSIVVLDYKTAKESNDTFNFVNTKKQGYFNETKILTKYKIYKQKNTIIIIYSETFENKIITETFKCVSTYLAK